MSFSDKQIRHGYSVIRASLDDHRDETAPVGVIAWDATRNWYGWRWLQDDERVPGVDATTRKFMEITRNQIQRWADSHRVPYEPQPVAPTYAAFWQAVSEILSTAVQIDPPKAMAPMADPDNELEALFEAIVRPRQPRRQQTQRIDSALNRALGGLADRIPARVRVSAFGGAEEKVRRCLETEHGVLLVDGVNLAAPAARKNADALVSRFQRIREGHRDRPVSIIVGYTSSPGGLNGEEHMRDWIQAKLTDQVFDLALQDSDFRQAAGNARDRIVGRTPTELPS